MLADIEILLYKLKEKEHDSGKYIFSYSSEGIIVFILLYIVFYPEKYLSSLDSELTFFI